MSSLIERKEQLIPAEDVAQVVGVSVDEVIKSAYGIAEYQMISGEGGKPFTIVIMDDKAHIDALLAHRVYQALGGDKDGEQ